MRATPNSGIALIMVLGLLTVMVILAVTFAISMRTERLAAGNAADTVRARELVQVGLARAMNDLANDLGTSGLASSTGGKAYPSWNVTNSYTNINGTPAARWNYTNALIQRSATNYVPRALWTEATNADRSISLSPSNHWLPVESLIYTNAGGIDYLAESNLMGRVAYLILNCSGLLDANYAGGAARQFGTNPAEIAIGKLDEIGVKSNDFINARANDVRYETLAQLNSAGDFYKPATNLFVYSRSLPGYWSTNWGCVATQVNLSGGRAEVGPRSADIFNALTEIGFVDPERGIIFRNLLDYVDPDLVPEDYITSVEPVPMINEMVFSNTVNHLVGPPEQWIVNCGASFELWYPFVSGVVTCSYTAAVAFVSSAGTLTAGGQQNNRILSTNQPFDVISFSANSNCNVDPGTFNIRIDAARVMNGSDKLDELDSCVLFSGMAQNTSRAWECLDPRFNKSPTNSAYWRVAATPILGATNVWVTEWWTTNPDGDTNSAMYVANTNLKSVAELGYLAYAPWRTVKLYGTNLHRVLDVFGLSTNTSAFITNTTVYRGLVNCNPNVATDATAVVFADMPVDQYPDGPSTPVSMPEAQAFVFRLFTRGICTNLSDVGRNLNSADFTFPAGMNELQREAYFRNAFNLLNLRQNMFTIIIEAQAASGGNIPRNPAKQRAVAIVWRDPYTGEMFIRHIKWLGD